MGSLAKLANTDKLKGGIKVNFADGSSRVFESEEQAEAALGPGAKLEHRRGAFFVVGDQNPAPKAKSRKQNKRRKSEEAPPAAEDVAEDAAS